MTFLVDYSLLKLYNDDAIEARNMIVDRIGPNGIQILATIAISYSAVLEAKWTKYFDLVIVCTSLWNYLSYAQFILPRNENQHNMNETSRIQL